jgi:hypothetical protein
MKRFKLINKYNPNELLMDYVETFDDTPQLMSAEMVEDELNHLYGETRKQKNIIDCLRKENEELNAELMEYDSFKILFKNNNDFFKQELNNVLQELYEKSKDYRKPISKIQYGEDIGYWNGVKQTVEEIAEKFNIHLK